MRTEKDLRHAVAELYFWKTQPKATNFTAMLYTLMSKADLSNKSRLAEAYPDEYMAWSLWQTAESEEEFFRSWLADLATN